MIYNFWQIFFQPWNKFFFLILPYLRANPPSAPKIDYQDLIKTKPRFAKLSPDIMQHSNQLYSIKVYNFQAWFLGWFKAILSRLISGYIGKMLAWFQAIRNIYRNSGQQLMCGQGRSIWFRNKLKKYLFIYRINVRVYSSLQIWCKMTDFKIKQSLLF